VIYRPDSILAVAGAVWPAFGIVYADGIVGFSAGDNHARRVAGDRNALWYVMISGESLPCDC